MPLKRHIDPIAQFMQEHDEALVQLASLNKATLVIAEHGFTIDAYRRVLSAVEFIEQEEQVHNISEEAALFPVLERYVEGPTAVMREDHKQLKKEFRRLRVAADRLGADRKSKKRALELSLASKSMVQMLVNHIHKENHILFPLVQKFLTKDALREVARRML